MLAAAVSSEKIFGIFLSLLEPLGDLVDVVLESSHESVGDYHIDLRRGDIDRSVLESTLYDYEELILNDGCLGIAVVANEQPIEVQFDEHKLLFVYSSDLKPFRKILRSNGIVKNQSMSLIAESEHIHYSKPSFYDKFKQLSCQIGAEDFDSVLSDENGWLGC